MGLFFIMGILNKKTALSLHSKKGRFKKWTDILPR